MSCTKCGLCCRAILICCTKEELKRSQPDGRDTDFIIKNWTRISFKTALKINPEIATRVDPKAKKYFYSCKLLINGLCSVHEEKPWICSEFPYYGKEPNTDYLYHSKCGYYPD